MKTHLLPALVCVLLTAVYAAAQNAVPPLPSQPAQQPPPPDAAPAMPPLPEATTAPSAPAPAAQPEAGVQPSPAVTQTGTSVDSGVSGTSAPAAPAAPTSTPPPLATVGSEPPSPQNLIRVNFQNASLTDVLNYLSDAAGFIIVEETPVSGTVNVVSKHPINADEAVDLLNSVLFEKGYTAIRNGRILKIVSSHDAQTHDLPVKVGADPQAIPRNDAKVTQILTIRYMDAAKLLDNLRPLLSTDAAISSNESSNAIILTDTQANIHRMAEIIHALDTSISSISTIKVFPLRYADAKDFANVLTQLFSPDQASSSNRQGQPQVPAFFARFAGGGGGGGRGGGGGGGGNAEPESEARKAASRVVAVPDEQSNSVVVSAPDEYMTTISDIVSRLDTSTTDVTETRIFRLEHADSVELSNIVNSLYGDPSTVTPNGNRSGQNQQNGQRPNNNNNGNPRQQAATAGANGQPSERSLLEARVIAVPDPRTNTIIVNSSHDTMEQIALTIGRLDATDSKKQHVYVHVLEHADPDNVATILRGMFGDSSSTSTNSSQPTSSLLNQRTTTGASSSVTGTLNTGGSSGGGGGGGSRNSGGFQ